MDKNMKSFKLFLSATLIFIIGCGGNTEKVVSKEPVATSACAIGMLTCDSHCQGAVHASASCIEDCQVESCKQPYRNCFNQCQNSEGVAYHSCQIPCLNNY